MFCEYTETGSPATALVSTAMLHSHESSGTGTIGHSTKGPSLISFVQLITVTTCPTKQLGAVIMSCWAEVYCRNLVGEK